VDFVWISMAFEPAHRVPLGDVIALLAPGQGAQTPGMLAPWLELPAAEDRVATWSRAAGLDLRRLGTTADADEIKDTAVTQPLIVALSLLVFEELTRRVKLPSIVVAGHSVGELAAAAAAGALSADDAVALAAMRGAEMGAACALEPTGMAAVLGGDQDEVLSRLDQLGLDPANRNGAGQIVAAGPRTAIDELVAQPPAQARVMRIPVAGAFHTRFMEPARAALARHIGSMDPGELRQTLLSNRDGRAVGSGAEVLRMLVAQVTTPVRWDACMATLRELGVSATIELPPAGTLSGLIRRELKDVTRLPIKKPEDLDTAAEMLRTPQFVGSPA
jgi:[acyl-carrier-protein] S-malonyltransferase